MRRLLLRVVVVCVVSFAAGSREEMLIPACEPPPQPRRIAELDRVIRLDVEYDDAFEAQHGSRVAEVLAEAIAIHNVEWRRYRREWFVLGDLTFRPSGEERDASYVLARFLQRTVHAPNTIHVNVLGRPLEVYTSGTRAMPIGGLAYRGSDALLLSATPGVSAELLAYYLFHEIGHCWDALDIPFHGGETTFGSKTRMTFDVDAGNEEIIEVSAGPASRDAPYRAPSVIRRKLARARQTAGGTPLYVPLHDLLLHEPSPANPAYVARRDALLAAAGERRPQIERLLRDYEITPRQARDDADLRRQIAEHYWRANDAIRARDYETAETELATMRVLASDTPDVHMLVGAVARKVRHRR